MRLFDFFRKDKKENKTAESIFKDSKEADIVKKTCNECNVRDICKLHNKNSPNYLCGFTQRLNDFDFNKPSILLFDDNMGVISVLEDDLQELEKEGFIKLEDYNILKFSTQHAAFQLQATIKAYQGLNIELAIFDITLGGGVYEEDLGNVVLDGVDTFKAVSDYNQNLKYIFFTGNKLNPYINKNKEIIEKYKKYTGEDIQDHILYKASLSPEDRKEYIKNFILG